MHNYYDLIDTRQNYCICLKMKSAMLVGRKLNDSNEKVIVQKMIS